MICPRCADAAVRRAGRDEHCDDAGCTCGHDVERYGRTTGETARAKPASQPGG